MTWAQQPLTGFALATTEIDPQQSRIVAVASRTVNDGTNAPATVTILRTPVSIPTGASRVHGITDAIAANGHNPADVVRAVVADLDAAAQDGRGVVLFNATWFFRTLAHEAVLNDVPFTIPAGLCIVDPLVMDLHLTSSRRSGNRTLRALAREWGVQQDQYGRVEQNLDAAMRLAWRVGTKHPAVRNMTLPALHAAQGRWKREADEERETYLASRGRLIPA